MTKPSPEILRAFARKLLEPDQDDAPYVCPGCYAVGGERCAPGCIDAEIEEDRGREYETREDNEDDYDRDCDGDWWP